MSDNDYLEEDDLDATRVSNIDKLRAELLQRTQRDRAYLIVLAETTSGRCSS